MAQKTIIELTDDLDGTPAEQTVLFSFRGTEYEIDLSDKNAVALEKALSKYLAAARRIPQTRHRPMNMSRRRPASEVAALREWARQNGYEIASRGRIPEQIRIAHDAAQRRPQAEPGGSETHRILPRHPG